MDVGTTTPIRLPDERSFTRRTSPSRIFQGVGHNLSRTGDNSRRQRTTHARTASRHADMFTRQETDTMKTTTITTLGLMAAATAGGAIALSPIAHADDSYLFRSPSGKHWLRDSRSR